jgi:hypothetical protein
VYPSRYRNIRARAAFPAAAFPSQDEELEKKDKTVLKLIIAVLVFGTLFIVSIAWNVARVR